MGSKVYVVTQGEYSDYRIIGLFSSKDKADQLIASYPPSCYSGQPRVEEYELDKVGIPKGERLFRVSICVEGGVGRMETYVWAKDKQHAAKIANERRVQTIANSTWEGM